MDPLTAISLVSSILQVIDFGAKLVSTANEIHRSASSASLANQSIEVVVSNLEDLSSKLEAPQTGQPSDDELALRRLAAECGILSEQILSLLKKIKPKNPKSKLQSMVSAIKTVGKDGELKELTQRLQNCRSQLQLQLNFLTRSDTKASLEAVARGSEYARAKLDLIQKQISTLTEGVTVTSMSPEFEDALRDVLGIATEDITRQRIILKALAFSDMDERFCVLSPAHKNTFGWIFDEAYDGGVEDDEKSVDKVNDSEKSSELDGNLGASPSSLTADDSDSQSQDDNLDAASDGLESEADNPNISKPKFDDSEGSNSPSDSGEETESEAEIKTHYKGIKHSHKTTEPFLQWLSTGGGIFHISGKLGSGKSTLMKYLCTHKCTKSELLKWAGPRKLVFSKFFFWKHGSVLQKSLDGLLRCLLHEVLYNCPELIPKVFADQWNIESTKSRIIGADLRLENSEIRTAFTRLTENACLYENRCFCFFIDGLDEYEGSLQEDEQDLIDLLVKWTQGAPENLKICVSSRDYPIFQNALPADKRLLLQDLTRGDMERYTRDRLATRTTKWRLDDKTTSDLVNTILDKADGIFLWVVIVVKSLRNLLEEKHKPHVLMKEIDKLPKELDGLFRHVLLEVLSPYARNTVYKTFAMLQALDSIPNPLSLSLFAYSFLEDYDENPEFAIEMPFKYEKMTADDKRARKYEVRQTLIASTKGLVQVAEGSVKYTHRSIPEFLNTKEVRDQMNDDLQKFEAADAVSQLLVAELRVDACLSGKLDREKCSGVVFCLLLMRMQFKVDHEPYSFLESLESVLIQHGGFDTTQYPVDYKVGWGIIQVLGSITQFFDIIYAGSASDAVANFTIISPLHISVYLGFENYVCWKIHRDQRVLNQGFDMAVLVSILTSDIFLIDETGPMSLQILEFLLEQGLSPYTVVYNSSADTRISADDCRTVWAYFLVHFSCWTNTVSNSKRWVGQALEMLLGHGADPSVWISFARVGDYGFRIKMEGPGIKTVLCYRVFPSCHPYLTTKSPASFRELVEYWDFENRESLLRLIDENIKKQEQQREAGIRQEQQSPKSTAESVLTRGSLWLMDSRLYQYMNIWFVSIKMGYIVTFGLGLFMAAVVPRLWVYIVRYKLSHRHGKSGNGRRVS